MKTNTVEINNNSKNRLSSLHSMRLIFGVALVGIMAGATHGFYLGAKPMSLHQVATASRHELETHTGTDYRSDANSIMVDPRHVRGIRRTDD